MYIQIFGCGLTPPVEHAVSLAFELNKQRRRDQVAVIDMSNVNTISMVANKLADPCQEKRPIPWMERGVAEDDLKFPSARLKFSGVPVFKGVEYWPKLWESLRTGPNPVSTAMFAKNQQIIQRRFPFILGLSEFVVSDATATQVMCADLVLFFGDTDIEVQHAMDVAVIFHPKVVLFRELGVSSYYRAPPSIKKNLRSPSTSSLARFLKNLAKGYPIEDVEKRIMTLDRKSF